MDKQSRSGTRGVLQVLTALHSGVRVHYVRATLIIIISLSSFASPQLLANDCVKSTAYSQVGVREEGGNNKGSVVKMYLANAGIYNPAPWCGAFVKWVLDVCCIDHWITAWSPSGTARNRIYDRRTPSKNTVTPQSMDVFTLYYPSLKRIGHVGFIDEWGDKWVTTVEGNTNDAGSRDSNTGDGVMRRKRLKSTIYQVSRPNYSKSCR